MILVICEAGDKFRYNREELTHGVKIFYWENWQKANDFLKTRSLIEPFFMKDQTHLEKTR